MAEAPTGFEGPWIDQCIETTELIPLPEPRHPFYMMPQGMGHTYDVHDIYEYWNLLTTRIRVPFHLKRSSVVRSLSQELRANPTKLMGRLVKILEWANYQLKVTQARHDQMMSLKGLMTPPVTTLVNLAQPYSDIPIDVQRFNKTARTIATTEFAMAMRVSFTRHQQLHAYVARFADEGSLFNTRLSRRPGVDSENWNQRVRACRDTWVRIKNIYNQDNNIKNGWKSLDRPLRVLPGTFDDLHQSEFGYYSPDDRDTEEVLEDERRVENLVTRAIIRFRTEWGHNLVQTPTHFQQILYAPTYRPNMTGTISGRRNA